MNFIRQIHNLFILNTIHARHLLGLQAFYISDVTFQKNILFTVTKHNNIAMPWSRCVSM